MFVCFSIVSHHYNTWRDTRSIFVCRILDNLKKIEKLYPAVLRGPDGLIWRKNLRLQILWPCPFSVTSILVLKLNADINVSSEICILKFFYKIAIDKLKIKVKTKNKICKINVFIDTIVSFATFLKYQIRIFLYHTF